MLPLYSWCAQKVEVEHEAKQRMEEAVAAAARDAARKQEEDQRALQAQLVEAQASKRMAEANAEEARNSAMVGGACAVFFSGILEF